jgi:heme/copper-type cytochrome/quinol oxidase subunit 3
MFFFAFFWAFFHSSIAPVYNIGGVWPPKAITPMDTYTIPLTNTFLLLTSGATVTWAHHALVARAKKQALLALLLTLILAILFTSLQGLEYVEASFNISDGVYGSCFYMATGFHGFHVFVGTIALLVSFVRIVFNHYTNHHHFGFESAIWYWHFVDVVWLFLFINVYWWSNSGNIPANEAGGFSRLNIFKEIFIFMLEEGGTLFFWGCELLFIVTTLLLFILLYLTTRKTDSFYKRFFELYAPMPFIHKLALFSFSVSFAIPVRIWIKTNLPVILTTTISFTLLYLATIFPSVAIFVFFQVSLLISSLIFVLSYENLPSFKNFICKVLFAGNEAFALLYFDFFWGNMNSNNVRRLTEVGASAVMTWLAREARDKAVKEAETKGIERSQRAIQRASEPVDAAEVYYIERTAVKDARSENPILHTEDTIKEKATAVSNWFFGS